MGHSQEAAEPGRCNREGSEEQGWHTWPGSHPGEAGLALWAGTQVLMLRPRTRAEPSFDRGDSSVPEHSGQHRVSLSWTREDHLA